MNHSFSPFRLPVRVFIARGGRRAIVPELARVLPGAPTANAPSPPSVLLVTDAGLLNTPWPDAIRKDLEAAGLRVIVDAGTKPNPRANDINALADTARAAGCAAVVGLGGGSVLDAAKAVAMLLRNPGVITDYEGKNRFTHASAPFIAVPTTCGTGSEVTWVSVISDPERHVKISVKGDGMFPTAAIVDTDLLDSLPTPLVATTGMDAVTHAIEAMIGLPANITSDTLALAALSRLVPALGTDLDDPATRTRLMEGSTIAGMAFGNADVGAVHCLSEAIGGLLDLPHGLLNAVLLAPVLRYTAAEINPYLLPVETHLGLSRPLQDEIDALRVRLGIPDIPGLGIDPGHHAEIARLAEGNGSNASNRRNMTAADYQEILQTTPGRHPAVT
ncbi:MAG: iron-containing alcohol dehydrogenase [Rhodothermales bacterium]